MNNGFYKLCWLENKKLRSGGRAYIEDSKAVVGNRVSAYWPRYESGVFSKKRMWRIGGVDPEQYTHNRAMKANKLIGVKVGN